MPISPVVNVDTAPSPLKQRGFAQLGLRIVSGVVLAAIAGLAAWRGFPWYDLLVGIVAAIAVGEWLRLTGGWRRIGWALGGLLYLSGIVLMAYNIAMTVLGHQRDEAPIGGRAPALQPAQ